MATLTDCMMLSTAIISTLRICGILTKKDSLWGKEESEMSLSLHGFT